MLSGSNLQNLNLPIDPNGIVYDALSRAPIAGATVSLAAPAAARRCRRAASTIRTSRAKSRSRDGYYKFDLNFADPACPSGGSYLLRVTPPSAAYLPGVSDIIPPQSAAATAAFVVPSCPASIDDAVPATAQHCEAAPSEFAAAGVRGAAHERHELPPAPDVRRQLRAGLEPDLQQPHSARSRPRRVRRHHEDDADWSTSRAASSCRT